MIDFDTAINIGEEVLASLEKIYHLMYPNGQNATLGRQEPRTALEETDATSLLQIRRRLLATHAKRHLVTELTATGKLTKTEAQALVDAGAAPAPGSAPAAAPFANILAWLQTNGPSISADIAAAIPVIISLITLFEG